MREQLLNPNPSGPGAGEEAAARPERRRFSPLRGGDGDPCLGAAGCLGGFLLLIALSSLAFLDPNQIGIVRNRITGNVDPFYYRGGVHLLGPLKVFLPFPATQMTMEFSAQSLDRPAVQTRTGADPKDPDSGGQPISISCAFQYQFIPDQLRDVYLAFGSYEAARQRFLLLGGNKVSNTAQDFTPQDFWERRDHIAARMLHEVNQTLIKQGVMAVRFQIMKVDFADSFENSITQVQVAEQQKVVNEYEQQVQVVVQRIEVMKSENLAQIANIAAGGQAHAKKIEAGAKRDAFNLKQGMKARKYAELQKTLEFTGEEMTEYFKIKSVQNSGKNAKIVVGMKGFGTGSGAPAAPRRMSADHVPARTRSVEPDVVTAAEAWASDPLSMSADL